MLLGVNRMMDPRSCEEYSGEDGIEMGIKNSNASGRK